MGVALMDPSFATARHVDELTDEALPGLPPTEVQWLRGRVAELEAEVARARRHECPAIYTSATTVRWDPRR